MFSVCKSKCISILFVANVFQSCLLQVFKMLAKAYADAHPVISDRSELRCGGNFVKRGGIINGAEWYSFTGGKTTLPSYQVR